MSRGAEYRGDVMKIGSIYMISTNCAVAAVWLIMSWARHSPKSIA